MMRWLERAALVDNRIALPPCEACGGTGTYRTWFPSLGGKLVPCRDCVRVGDVDDVWGPPQPGADGFCDVTDIRYSHLSPVWVPAGPPPPTKEGTT